MSIREWTTTRSKKQIYEYLKDKSHSQGGNYEQQSFAIPGFLAGSKSLSGWNDEKRDFEQLRSSSRFEERVSTVLSKYIDPSTRRAMLEAFETCLIVRKDLAASISSEFGLHLQGSFERKPRTGRVPSSAYS